MNYRNLKCLIFLVFSSFMLKGQEIDIYGEMYPILGEVNFIGDYGEGEFDELEFALNALKESGLDFKAKVEENFTAISRDVPPKDKLQMKTYLDSKSNFKIQMVVGDSESLQSFFSKVRPESGSWTGYQTFSQKFVYMLRDTTRNSLAGTMLISNNAILSITQPVDFRVTGRATTMSEEQKGIAKNSFNKILAMTQTLSKYLVPEKAKIFKMSDEELTAEERVYGFTQFWTEVKYNFAFFDQVPDLNWDEVYLEYLPIIMAKQSNAAYFKNLEKICALLHDGHTNIYPPSNLAIDYPAVTLERIAGKAIVSNMDKSLAQEIPKGSEVIEVDGMKTEDFLKKNVLPYISSSTEHILQSNAVQNMLEGEPDSSVKLKLRSLQGKESVVNLTRNRSKANVEWNHKWPGNNKLLELIPLENKVAQIKLNSFSNEDIVTDFEAIMDTLHNFDHFIIDLRNNGGGNSGNGYNILKYFADKPFLTSNWRTLEHKGAYKAWGGQYVGQSEEDLDEWALEAKQTYEGSYWHIGEPDTIRNEKKIEFKGDLIVLISNNTASAAEDFLVALDDLGFGKLIGQPTFGSTGQPLFVKLPRGGNARVCTKKDTYPDGREFVGFGIQPDIMVEKTVEDFLTGRDVELERALSIIK